MNMLMLFASAGHTPVLQTVTFNSNTTWVAPTAVTLLVTVSGHGTNGTAPVLQNISYDLVNVNYRTDTSTGSGNATWGSFSGYADGVVADMNADGAASWTQYFIDVWPDGTNTYTGTNTISDSGNNPGSAYWSSPSGAITSSGSVTMYLSYYTSGSSGTAATGFSKTFAGGTPSVPTAPTTTYNNVTVVSGSSYPVVVPSGATIQITYYT